jgi:hypothetical protein
MTTRFTSHGVHLLAVVALGYAATCSLGCESEAAETTRYENEGASCLSTETDGRGFVRVVFDSCASYCATIESAECEVQVDGADLRVTSHAEVSEPTVAGRDCPTVCQVVEATCPVGPLAQGEYTFHLGGATRPVRVPGRDDCE